MESVIKSKAEARKNIEEEIQIKSKTTKQILKSLDNYLGIPKRTKEVIKMYADYIKLYKKNKIKVGNLNMILYCDNNNYTNVVNIINKLLYKEGITRFSNYELLTEVSYNRNNVGANDLCVIYDENLKEYKINKLLRDYPKAVFIVICNNSNRKIIDNINSSFSWEIDIDEPTPKEKIKYIKNTIKEHGLECKVTSSELEALTGYDIETIDSSLIGAILRANKKKIDYISKEELHIIKNSHHKEGMQKLNKLVGLNEVKQQVKQIINYIQVHKQRGTMPNLHMVFKGNPRLWENRSSKNYWRNLFRLWNIRRKLYRSIKSRFSSRVCRTDSNKNSKGYRPSNGWSIIHR